MFKQHNNVSANSVVPDDSVVSDGPVTLDDPGILNGSTILYDTDTETDLQNKPITAEQRRTIYDIASGRCSDCNLPVSFDKAHFILHGGEILCPFCTAILQAFYAFPETSPDTLKWLISVIITETTGHPETPRQNLTSKQIRDISGLLVTMLRLLEEKSRGHKNDSI
jgi:hypothetical protein